MGLRNVCHAVRSVASEMISLGAPRTGFSRDERFVVYAQRDLLDYDVMLLENFR